jgi:outer membrane lipoprotein carrier protein
MRSPWPGQQKREKSGAWRIAILPQVRWRGNGKQDAAATSSESAWCQNHCNNDYNKVSAFPQLTSENLEVQSLKLIFCLLATMILLSFGLLSFPGTVSAAGPADVNSVAAAVDAHYNHVKTLQAEFTEVYRGAGMDRTESGTLWLKKPGKMRWEYRSPREKVFLSDGKDAWFYVPDDRQARKTPAKKLGDIRSPLSFLLGKTKLEKELRGLSFAPDLTPAEAGDVILRGVPVGMEGRVNEIRLEVTADHRIERIVIEDEDGSATEYRFADQKEDVAVADSKFQFNPPAGTEIVEGVGP